MTVLDLQYNFASLSISDLLDARDQYHYHLMSKPNMVGTAVGLYLIRKDEAWPTRPGEGKSPVSKKTYPRTLFNSEVRDYSWPCIIAFVRRWADEEAFAASGQYDPASIVPKTLYMPDGRAVPVCVVEAPPQPRPDVSVPAIGPRPSAIFGGGCPIQIHSQGEIREATAGALVSDGHAVYAITARHACGEAGEVAYSLLRNKRERIGRASPKQLTRVPFSEVYPDFPGRRSYVAIDAGLIRIENVRNWTSNTYGLPSVGPLADVHEHNLSIRLIDQPVIGYGAASGIVTGTIKALFYRYRSVGGFDYVGDFLIAPQEGRHVRPGDSGMVWHLDVTRDIRTKPDTPLDQRDLRPLALEWGGQVFEGNGTTATFAVATSLSTVCRVLDVELATDLNRTVSGYWGRTGHYSIAAIAIGLVKEPKLKKLLEENAGIFSFELSDIAKKGFDKSIGQLANDDQFVPLADVPDEVWKKLPKSKGGRAGGRDTSGGARRSNGPEHPTHYADVDAIYSPHGKSLRELCAQDPDKFLTVDAWLKYYEDAAAEAETAGDQELAKERRSRLKQGLLPFRVWQFFNEMRDFVASRSIAEFVTAAGIVAHYVGDGSQPLHGSVMADGDRSRQSSRTDDDGNPVIYGKDVHSAFETAMVSRFATDLLSKAEAQASHITAPSPSSGREAAEAIIDLMGKASKTLPPKDILEAFENSGGTTHVADLEALYAEVGKPTAKLLALGAVYLAAIWEGAWKAGKGATVPASELEAFEPEAIKAIYTKPSFVPSLTLDKIGEALN